MLTRFILAEGGREVLCACCITTLSKAQLWQSYCGAASTWAIFPAPLLQSRQVWTRARMRLMLWPAPLTVLGLVWRLSAPVPQSNGWELAKCTQRQCWTNLLARRILGTRLCTGSNRAATSTEDWEDRGWTVGKIREVHFHIFLKIWKSHHLLLSYSIKTTTYLSLKELQFTFPKVTD